MDRCLVFDHDCKQWPLGAILLFAHAEEDDRADSFFHVRLLRVSDHTGSTANSRQEKKYCQFKVCMLLSFYMVKSCEKDLWLEIYIFKSGYKLGDVVLQDGWSRAVLLRAGITPSSNQAHLKPLLTFKVPLLYQKTSRNFSRCLWDVPKLPLPSLDPVTWSTLHLLGGFNLKGLFQP